MLESIITSKERIKLLLKFFLNPDVKAYLRELSSEFGDSTNAVRVELNRLVDAKLLITQKSGRNIYYSANKDHPLYPEINSILKKMTGIDSIYERLLGIGNLHAAYITGDYARGIDSGIIDLLLVGDIDMEKVNAVISQTEKKIKRRIRPFVMGNEEFAAMIERFKKERLLLIWGNGGACHEQGRMGGENA